MTLRDSSSESSGLKSRLLIWKRYFDFSINTAPTQIENIWPVCCYDNFDLWWAWETINLGKKFHQWSLDFMVCWGVFLETYATKCVDFIDVYFPRHLFLCVCQHLTSCLVHYCCLFEDKIRHGTMVPWRIFTEIWGYYEISYAILQWNLLLLLLYRISLFCKCLRNYIPSFLDKMIPMTSTHLFSFQYIS